MTREESLRAIVGALRAAIHDHGPITGKYVGSAAKRILGQLENAKRQALARYGRSRWASLSREERTVISSAGGRKAWAAMNAAERSDEMKRRYARRRNSRLKSP
jgi:hypothetical protein